MGNTKRLKTLSMTKKRRNNGRAKNSRGHVRRVYCELTGTMVPKDKAIKKYEIKDVYLEKSTERDLQKASAIDGYALPKIYRKMYYCISAALHSGKVCVRSREMRRIRTIVSSKNLYGKGKSIKKIPDLNDLRHENSLFPCVAY